MECLPNFVCCVSAVPREDWVICFSAIPRVHSCLLLGILWRKRLLSFSAVLKLFGDPLLYVSYAKNPLNICMHCFKVGLQWQHLIRSQLEKAWGTTRFFISGSNKECSMHIFSNMYSFSCCFHLSVQGICLGVLNRLMSKQCSTLYLHKQGPA